LKLVAQALRYAPEGIIHVIRMTTVWTGIGVDASKLLTRQCPGVHITLINLRTLHSQVNHGGAVILI